MSEWDWLAVWWGVSLFVVWQISGVVHYKRGLDRGYEDAYKALDKLKQDLTKMGVIK